MNASPEGNIEELQPFQDWKKGNPQGNEAISLPNINFKQATAPTLDVVLSFSFANLIYTSQKRLMQNTNCPHFERKHYAKNMCSACYHKTARPSRAWKCPHSTLPLYAKGRCHDCYVAFYYRKRPADEESEA